MHMRYTNTEHMHAEICVHTTAFSGGSVQDFKLGRKGEGRGGALGVSGCGIHAWVNRIMNMKNFVRSDTL